MIQLKAEVAKMKEEHQSQIAQVTDSAASEISTAKAELAEREKQLRAEIETLRRENQTLKDTDKLQKEQAEVVAKKMKSWQALAQRLNEKMEG